MSISRTDWKKIDSMSDEELTRNAIHDPDNPPLDENFFANVKPIGIPCRKKQITIHSGKNSQRRCSCRRLRSGYLSAVHSAS